MYREPTKYENHMLVLLSWHGFYEIDDQSSPTMYSTELTEEFRMHSVNWSKITMLPKSCEY